MSKDRMISLLQQWVGINSWSHNKAGLAQMADALEQAFATLPCAVERLQLDSGKTVLRVRCRPTSPVQVILGGHYDTVHAPDSGFTDVTWLDTKRLQGPGIADMKGGLAILLDALLAFEKRPRSDVGWEVLLTPDEEIGSVESRALWEECAPRFSVALLFEPALPDGGLASSRAASLNFSVTIRGRASHVGRHRLEGVSATATLGEVIVALDALGVNVGPITGGAAANVVADHASCLCNIRTDSDAQMDNLWAKIVAQVEAICDRRGATLALSKTSQRPAKPFDEKTERQFTRLAQCAKSLGMHLHWEPTGGVCDGNFLGALGLPTIDTLGACGGGVHTTQEFIFVDSLKQRSKLVTNFLEAL